MKKPAKLFLFLFCIASLSGCFLFPEELEGDFWAIDRTRNYQSDEDAWYRVHANLVAAGTNCEVYLEEERSVSQAAINTIVSEFDNKMWPMMSQKFGIPLDSDGNGKIILLLMDIRDNYSGLGSSYVSGYFFGIDLYTTEELTQSGYPDIYKTNEAEILYVDVNPSDPDSPDTLSTIFHEFQHLVNTSENVFRAGRGQFPTWINEGFSMAAEAVYRGVDILPEREDWYDADPLYSGLGGVVREPGKSITYGYPLTLWNPYNSGTAVLNNYALSHLFFAWMELQIGNDDFYKTIMESPDNPKQDIIKTFSDKVDPQLDTPTEVIQMWYLANLLGGRGADTGLASYLGKNAHTGPFFFTSWDSGYQAKIYQSGAMHFSNTAINEYTPDGGDTNIGYAIGDTITKAYGINSPYGTGADDEILIVFNGQMEDDLYLAAPESSAPIPYSSNILMVENVETSQTTGSTDSMLVSSKKGFANTELPKEAFKRGLEPPGPLLDTPENGLE